MISLELGFSESRISPSRTPFSRVDPTRLLVNRAHFETLWSSIEEPRELLQSAQFPMINGGRQRVKRRLSSNS